MFKKKLVKQYLSESGGSSGSESSSASLIFKDNK